MSTDSVESRVTPTQSPYLLQLVQIVGIARIQHLQSSSACMISINALHETENGVSYPITGSTHGQWAEERSQRDDVFPLSHRSHPPASNVHNHPSVRSNTHSFSKRLPH